MTLKFTVWLNRVMLFHSTRSNDSRCSDARFMHNLSFFACHEQNDSTGNSPYRIKNVAGQFESGLIPFTYSKKLLKSNPLSFHQCKSRFARKTILLVQRIDSCSLHSNQLLVPGEFFTNVVYIVLSYSKKYINGVSHDLHTFVHVVSEAVARWYFKIWYSNSQERGELSQFHQTNYTKFPKMLYI